MKTKIRMTSGIPAMLLCLTAFASQAFVQENTWETKAPMPAARTAVGGVIDGKLLVATGSPDGTALEQYDPSTNTWTTKAPIPTPRWFAGSGVIGSKLYVVGGCSSHADCRIGTTSALEAYDAVSNTWSILTPMPTARSNEATGVIDGKLYVAGGIGPCPPCDQYATLEVYDPAANSWATKPMPSPREAATGGVIDGKLYVVGGWLRPANGVTGLLQVYDPVTDTWETRASMPTSRQSPGVGVINGQLHVVGGESASGPVATHDVYDPTANTWTTAPPMPTKRTRPTADVINGKLYVAGGVDCIPFVRCFEVDVLEVYSPAGNQACVPPPSGSVSWWDGDSVSGTTASDISDGNNGTMLDGVSISPGIVGSAFNFDGSTGRINAGNPATLNFGTAGPFSLEAWFKWDGSGSSVNNIIRKSNYPVSGPGAGYWLRIGRDSHTLEFFAGETTGAPGFPKGIITTSVTPGVWHHVAGTRDSSGTMNLYLDGELKGTTQALNANTTSEAAFVLGAWDDRFGVIEFFSGLMDEVSVYNRALNASEVQSIFNAGSMGKCKGNGNTSPIAACNNVTVAAGPDCMASASIDNGSVDPDGDPITITQSPSGPYPLGSTSVTLTVTDSHGASSQCTATVTVVDNTPPTIGCPPNIVVDNSNSPGQCSSVVNYSVTATDNCSGGTVACSPPSGSIFAKGATGVTCTATDLGGNTSACSFTVTVIPPQLTALSPAMVWIGLKNSDDVGTKFDLLAEMLRNGTPIVSGQIDNVTGGSSGFNNAVLRTIDLALSAPVDICPGDAFSLRLSVRIAAASGHRAGTARLWFNDSAANSRFGATIGAVTKDYYLAGGLSLSFTPGPGPKNTIDVLVDRAVGGNPFKPFATWSITF